MPTASSPHVRLRAGIEKWAGTSSTGDIPTRWEKFSDVVLLPQNAFTNPEWNPDQELWEIIAEALDVTRIGRIGEVSGPMRESSVELLLGDDDWVVRREHGIDFGYHFTRCMWSSGNVTERGRIANTNHEGEHILDLYAGIGYYTLPFLTGGARGANGQAGLGCGAEHVVACEWNPEAIAALRWSLEKNGVYNRCTIVEGDNRNSLNETYFGTFDRVNLGLLPSSEEGYNIALQALKSEGGMLHVHGLAKGGNEQRWAEKLVESLSKIGPFHCTIKHLELVKWYAPHQRHIVVDVQALPVTN